MRVACGGRGQRVGLEAEDLSLFRSLANFRHERQRRVRGGKKSLPDYERKILRAPSPLIGRFMGEAT